MILGDLAFGFNRAQGFDFGRSVVMAVIGADHDVIFADTFRQIGNVFIGFAGDK